MTINLRAYPTVVASLTALSLGAVAGTQTQAQASDNWGWQPAPELGSAPGLETVWKDEDGARGAYLLISKGQQLALDGVTNDAKLVVVKGAVTVAGVPVGQHGFAQLPASSSRQIECLNESDCLVFVEEEPTRNVISASVVQAADIPWFEVPNTGGNVSLAWVWGEAESAAPSSFFLRFKPGFPGFQHAHTHAYHGLVLQGAYKHWAPDDAKVPTLPVGATLWQNGLAAHDDACDTDEECIAYFRIEDAFDVYPAE